MKLPSFPIFNGKKKPEDDFNPFPDLPPKKKLHKIKTEYVILSIVLAVFFVSLSLYITNKPQPTSNNNPQQAQATPTPTPKPLPSGKRIYNGSHGSDVTGPKPTQIIIDPIDPEIGDKQTLTLKIPHDKPIINATAVLVTDNQHHHFTLINTSSDLWNTEWEAKDTYDYNYQIQLNLSDENETFTGALTFR